MQFNIKLTEYSESGTGTITIYDDLVGMPDDIEIDRSHKDTGPQLELNPFTGEYMEVTETEEEKYYRKQALLTKSVGRSKKKVQELMRAGSPWEYFVTLTFSPQKIDRTDFTLCSKKIRKWLQNIRRNEGAENMRFICIPELHKDCESWHAHALLSGVGNLKLTDSGHKTKKGQTIYNIDGWTWGFSTAIEIGSAADDSIKLSKYVTKYFTKQSFMRCKNRHRFFASNNIPKPRVTRMVYENEEDKEAIIDSILQKKGYEIAYNAHFDGSFVNADYLEVTKALHPPRNR